MCSSCLYFLVLRGTSYSALRISGVAALELIIDRDCVVMNDSIIHLQSYAMLLRIFFLTLVAYMSTL
jgi:hypothetical protein